jgi:hypothetical protein
MRNIFKSFRSKYPADKRYAALMLLTLTCTMLVTEAAHADTRNCTVTLSPAEHNYGDLLKGRQNFFSTPIGNATQLSDRSSNLSITCPQAERLVMRFTGPGISDGSFAFGTKGKVNVVLGSAVLDGNGVQLSKTKEKGIIHSPVVADSQPLHPDDEVTVGDNSSVKGMNFNAVVTVTPYLHEQAFVVQDATPQEELINVELLAGN